MSEFDVARWVRGEPVAGFCAGHTGQIVPCPRYCSVPRRSVTASAARIVTPRVRARFRFGRNNRVRPMHSPMTAKTITRPRPAAADPVRLAAGDAGEGGSTGVMSMMSGCASSIWLNNVARRLAYSSGDISPRSSRASNRRIALSTAVTRATPVPANETACGIGAELGICVNSCDVVNRISKQGARHAIS